VSFWLATGQWPDCVDQLPYDFRAACEQVRDTACDTCDVDVSGTP